MTWRPPFGSRRVNRISPMENAISDFFFFQSLLANVGQNVEKD